MLGVELDGGVIGTLDIYARQPRDWIPARSRLSRPSAGLMASLLSAATTAQVKGRLADQLQAALEHRWLIEQAKGVIMGREELTPKRPLSGYGGGLVLDPAAGRCGQGRNRRLRSCPPTGASWPRRGPGRPRTGKPLSSSEAPRRLRKEVAPSRDDRMVEAEPNGTWSMAADRSSWTTYGSEEFKRRPDNL